MLDRSRSLRETEAALRDAMADDRPRLFCALALTQADVQLLGEQIRSAHAGHFSEDTNRRLLSEAPVSFALFLAWQGVRHYRDGDYWPPVHEATGLPQPRHEAVWGGHFLSVLKQHGMPNVTHAGRRYVDSILLHGLPRSSVPALVERVVWPAVRDGDPGSRESSILASLAAWREAAAACLAGRDDEARSSRSLQAQLKAVHQTCSLLRERERVAESRNALNELLEAARTLQSRRDDEQSLTRRWRKLQHDSTSAHTTDPFPRALAAARLALADCSEAEVVPFATTEQGVRSTGSLASSPPPIGARQTSPAPALVASQIAPSRSRRHATGPWLLTIGAALAASGLWSPHRLLVALVFVGSISAAAVSFMRLRVLRRAARSRAAPAIECEAVASGSPAMASLLAPAALACRAVLDELCALLGEPPSSVSTVAPPEALCAALRGAITRVEEVRARRAEAIEAAEAAIRNELAKLQSRIESERSCLEERAAQLGFLPVALDPTVLSQQLATLDRRRESIDAHLNQLRRALPPGTPLTHEAISQLEETLPTQSQAAAAMGDGHLPGSLQGLDTPALHFLVDGAEEAQSLLIWLSRLASRSYRAGVATPPEDWPRTAFYAEMLRGFGDWWNTASPALYAERREFPPRPRLRAWYDDNAWMIGVDLGQHLKATQAATLTQGGRGLVPDQRGRFPLRSGGEEIEIALGDAVTLAFDPASAQPLPGVFLFRGWSTEGVTPLRTLHRGESAVVMLPQDWFAEGGHVRVEEVEAPSGYRALLCDGDPITLRTPDGRAHRLAGTGQQAFELRGNLAPEAFWNGAVPLFLGQPPLIDYHGATSMPVASMEIEPLGLTICEGDPAIVGLSPLPLPGSGAYLVRLFGHQREVLEELPLRLAEEVLAIRLDPVEPSLFPIGDAQEPEDLNVHFRVVTGWRIRSELAQPLAPSSAGETAFRVPAGPDAVIFEVQSTGGAAMPLTLQPLRALWTLGAAGTYPPPGSLTSKVLQLEEQMFAVRPPRSLFVQLPPALLGQIREISLEFAGSPRSFSDALRNGRRRGLIEAPLFEFRDARDIATDRDKPELLTARLMLRDKEIRAGLALWLPPRPHAAQACHFCDRDRGEEDFDPRDYQRTCSTCDHAVTAFNRYRKCVRGRWGADPSDTLPTAEAFARIRASYSCELWQGNYLGEPFTASEKSGLVGCRLMATKPSPLPAGLGAVGLGFAGQTLRLRLDRGYAMVREITVCHWHYENFFQASEENAP